MQPMCAPEASCTWRELEGASSESVPGVRVTPLLPSAVPPIHCVPSHVNAQGRLPLACGSSSLLFTMSIGWWLSSSNGIACGRPWTCAPPCILRRAAAPPPQHTEPCWHCAGPNPHSIAHRDSAYGTDATTARAHRARATPSRTRPTNNQRREIRIMSLWRRSLPCTAHWPHLEAMRDGRVSAADSRVCKSTDLRGKTVARWLMAVQ